MSKHFFMHISPHLLCHSFKMSVMEGWDSSGTYPGRLGDRYTGLGPQTLAPKKHCSTFLFSVVLQQKYVE